MSYNVTLPVHCAQVKYCNAALTVQAIPTTTWWLDWITEHRVQKVFYVQKHITFSFVCFHLLFKLAVLVNRPSGTCFMWKVLTWYVCNVFGSQLGCSIIRGNPAYLTVPLKSTGSCGMIDSLLRKSARPMSQMLISSILMEPPQGSTSR